MVWVLWITAMVKFKSTQHSNYVITWQVKLRPPLFFSISSFRPQTVTVTILRELASGGPLTAHRTHPK